MKISKYLVEFLGTCLFLFTFLRFPNPVMISLSLLLVMFAGSKVSGGHFNPVVSIVKHVKGDLKFEDMILYVIVQVLGGLFALSLFKML
jgi:aquaporin Z